MPSPHFLNVDLDIRVHADPQAIIDHWYNDLIVLVDESKSDLKLLRFECVEQYPNAAECIEAFCTLVEQLPPDLMRFWLECPERILDIGYESGSTKPVLIDALSAEVLIKLGKYFTGLNFTLYPAYHQDDTFPGIEKTPGVCGGSACIMRTRIPVWSLVASKKLGFSDVQLLENYPSLCQQDLDNAWNYYLIREQEIDMEILENDQAQ